MPCSTHERATWTRHTIACNAPHELHAQFDEPSEEVLLYPGPPGLVLRVFEGTDTLITLIIVTIGAGVFIAEVITIAMVATVAMLLAMIFTVILWFRRRRATRHIELITA